MRDEREEGEEQRKSGQPRERERVRRRLRDPTMTFRSVKCSKKEGRRGGFHEGTLPLVQLCEVYEKS